MFRYEDKTRLTVTVCALTLIGAAAAANAQPAADAPQPPAVHAEPSGGADVRMTFLGVVATAVDEALASHLRLPPGVGLLVEHVEDGSPADQAGLQRHDVLHQLNDQMLVNVEQLRALLQTHEPGSKVELTIIHRGESKILPVTLGARKVAPRHMLVWRGLPDVLMMEERLRDARQALAERQSTLQRQRLERALDDIAEHLRSLRTPFDAPARPWDWPGVRPHVPQLRGHEQHLDIHRDTRAVAKYADNDHELELTVNHAGERHLIVRDKRNDEVIFDGPVNTSEQRKALPETVLHKLEKLEKQTKIDVDIRIEHRQQRGAPPEQPDEAG